MHSAPSCCVVDTVLMQETEISRADIEHALGKLLAQKNVK